MAEQILRVVDGGTAYDLAVQTAGSNWSIRTNDEDTIAELQNILAKIDDNSVDTVLGVLKSMSTKIDSLATEATAGTLAQDTTVAGVTTAINAKDYATETTLNALLADVDDGSGDTLKGLLKSIIAIDYLTPADITGLATQSTVAAMDTKLANINSLIAKDSTLVSILAQLDDPSADTVLSVLKALNTIDYSTEATLAAMKTSIDTKLDNLANTLGRQVTLVEVRDALTGGQNQTLAKESTLNTFKNAFTAEDFASETTLAAQKASLEAKLDNIFGAVDGLEVSLGDVDLNTDQLEAKLDTLNTTQQSILTALGGTVTKQQQFVFTASNIYVGEADSGSATSDGVWTIKRVSLTNGSPTDTKWAINVAWDDYATETYT